MTTGNNDNVDPKAIDTSKMIQPSTFARVINAEIEGIAEGQLVFVAGMQSLPVDEDDLYMQRLYAFCHLTDDQADLNLEGFYVIDPRSLDQLVEEDAKDLMEKLQTRYGEPEGSA